MKRSKGAGMSLLSAALFFCWWGCRSPGGSGSFRPKTDTVYISMMRFQPAVITVNKYDTVVWINQDLVKHNVTDYPGQKWTSGAIQMNSSWSMIVSVSDSLHYFCSIHPTMKGTIIVRK